MPADIETRKCSIDTLAVTIQALHVSGKQMTLAVFRQLPKASFCCEWLRLAPAVQMWGVVVYQGSWVVFDRGGQLYVGELPNYHAIELDFMMRQKAIQRFEKEIQFAAESNLAHAGYYYDGDSEFVQVANAGTYRQGKVDELRADVEAWASLKPMLVSLPQLFIAV